MLFFFIAMMIYSISAITMAGGINQANNSTSEDFTFILISMITFFLAPVFFLVGSGAMLAGRNDLDRTHRIRSTLGSLIYLFLPLSGLLFFMMDDQGSFALVIFASINSFIAVTMGAANYIFTCHLTDPFYIPGGKRLTRWMIRGSSAVLLLTVAIYLIGVIVTYSRWGSLDDFDGISRMEDAFWNLAMVSSMIMSVYFFWISLSFLSLFIAISRNRMNEEALSMGRTAYHEEQYRLYQESLAKFEQQYGEGYYRGGYQEVEVAEVL